MCRNGGVSLFPFSFHEKEWVRLVHLDNVLHGHYFQVCPHTQHVPYSGKFLMSLIFAD